MIAREFHVSPREVRSWPGDDVERVLMLWQAEALDRRIRENQR